MTIEEINSAMSLILLWFITSPHCCIKVINLHVIWWTAFMVLTFKNRTETQVVSMIKLHAKYSSIMYWHNHNNPLLFLKLICFLKTGGNYLLCIGFIQAVKQKMLAWIKSLYKYIYINKMWHSEQSSESLIRCYAKFVCARTSISNVEMFLQICCMQMFSWWDCVHTHLLSG